MLETKISYFFFRCYNNKDGVVADFNSNTGCQMNFRRNLNNWEIDDFCQLLLQLDYTHIDQSKGDSPKCIASNDGTFSIKKCYRILMKQTRFWDTSWSWKGIWRTKAPIKVACFGWTVAWGAYLTQDNPIFRKRVCTN